jgi:ATP-binding cassette subfamily G (WHITE) protein 2 (SNQ2)
MPVSDLERLSEINHWQSVGSLPETFRADDDPSPHWQTSSTLAGRATLPVFVDGAGDDQPQRTLVDLSESRGLDDLDFQSSETLSVPTTGPFDFEKTIRIMIKKCVIARIAASIRRLQCSAARRDQAGIQPRELGVMFKDLHVVGLGATATFQPTFGSMFNPRVILENIQTLRHPPLRDILTGFEGVVRPGEMLRL